jgi:maltose O-acetyltransferase
VAHVSTAVTDFALGFDEGNDKRLGSHNFVNYWRSSWCGIGLGDTSACARGRLRQVVARRCANPGLPTARMRLGRVKARVLQRLRGELNVDRLIAQGLELGRGTFVARGVYLDPGHPWLITIGEESGLSPGVVVMAHDASMRRQVGYTRIARVVIGNRVFVGAGAILLPGSRIGDDSIVGAGAVVRGDVPRGSLVVGNPARVVSDVESVAEWHRRAATRAPVWPHEGWTIGRGITAARKREQRDALANGISGYLA